MPVQEIALPLFPLNVVLFPGGTLPLQIFEERYKLLMRDCMDADSKFGVVLIKSGTEVGGSAVPHSVGTIARVIQVNKADDGRMFISVLGQQRFKTRQITQTRPYIVAEVEVLEEGETAVGEAELSNIRQAAIEHVNAALGLGGGWIREPQIPSDPLVLSYFIPRILQTDLSAKQTLLEEYSTLKRLDAELSILQSEVSELKLRVARQLRSKFGRQ